MSADGDNYLGQKSDLLNTARDRVTWDGLIIDEAALVNIFQPGKELKTFDQYYSNTFAHHLTKQVTTVNATRPDVVWDTYVKQNSLNQQTQQNTEVKMVVRLSGAMISSEIQTTKNS